MCKPNLNPLGLMIKLAICYQMIVPACVSMLGNSSCTPKCRPFESCVMNCTTLLLEVGGLHPTGASQLRCWRAAFVTTWKGLAGEVAWCPAFCTGKKCKRGEDFRMIMRMIESMTDLRWFTSFTQNKKVQSATCPALHHHSSMMGPKQFDNPASLGWLPI
jgi:hypothetical protein